MAFVPAARTLQVEVRCLLDDQRIENTLYFRTDAAPVLADLTTVGGAIQTWFVGSLLPFLSVNLTLREVYVTDISSETGPTTTITPLTPEAGGSDAESMPGNVSACVSFRTNARGRSGRGRNYVPGIPDNKVTINTLDSSFADQLVTAYAELLSPETNGGTEWVVVSRRHNNADRVAALVQPIVNVLMTDNTVDSQRKRLPGRGT